MHNAGENDLEFIGKIVWTWLVGMCEREKRQCWVYSTDMAQPDIEGGKRSCADGAYVQRYLPSVRRGM